MWVRGSRWWCLWGSNLFLGVSINCLVIYTKLWSRTLLYFTYRGNCRIESFGWHDYWSKRLGTQFVGEHCQGTKHNYITKFTGKKKLSNLNANQHWLPGHYNELRISNTIEVKKKKVRVRKESSYITYLYTYKTI